MTSGQVPEEPAPGEQPGPGSPATTANGPPRRPRHRARRARDRRRVRVPRRIVPGRRRAERAGERLRCVVLARSPTEWVGVDLATGAFVRGDLHPEAGRPPGAGDWLAYDVIELELARHEDPADPARPELVASARPPDKIGRLRQPPLRRLLKRLVAPERPGAPVLGTWGPSIAYVDLEGTSPSVMLLALTPKSVELSVRADGRVVCAFTWGTSRNVIPIADPRAVAAAREADPRPLSGDRLAEAIGLKPAYALVGLGPVRAGQAPKVVFALLRR